MSPFDLADLASFRGVATLQFVFEGDGAEAVQSNLVRVEVFGKDVDPPDPNSIIKIALTPQVTSVKRMNLEGIQCSVLVENTSKSELIGSTFLGNPRECFNFEVISDKGEKLRMGWFGDAFISPFSVIPQRLQLPAGTKQIYGPFHPLRAIEAKLKTTRYVLIAAVYRTGDNTLVKSSPVKITVID